MSKKILIFANKDNGLYSFRKELLERMISEGNQVYCALPFGARIEALEELGCNCIETKMSRHGVNPFEDFKLILQYIKIIKSVKPDVVLTYTIKPNVYGGIACQLKKIPYIVTVTGLGNAIENGGLMRAFTLMLYRIGIKKAKCVVVQNEKNKKIFLENKVITGEYCMIPGAGVNLDKHCYEEYPENDENVVFSVIGRIMKSKGSEEILEAIPEIKKEYPNTVFRFIGDYDDDVMKEKIEKASEAGLVEYVGRQNDVHSFIKRSHATLHASYHEGMANVCIETASCGRPVVATDVHGCRETYDDGVSGIAFKAKDTQDLIRAVKEFLALPYEEKVEMGKAGRRKMEKEFNREIIVDKYMKIINEV